MRMRYIFSIVLILGAVFVFQNCGSSFNSSDQEEKNSMSGNSEIESLLDTIVNSSEEKMIMLKRPVLIRVHSVCKTMMSIKLKKNIIVKESLRMGDGFEMDVPIGQM